MMGGDLGRGREGKVETDKGLPGKTREQCLRGLGDVLLFMVTELVCTIVWFLKVQ